MIRVILTVTTSQELSFYKTRIREGPRLQGGDHDPLDSDFVPNDEEETPREREKVKSKGRGRPRGRGKRLV